MNKIINIVLIILLVVLVFSMSLTPLRSTNDAWWHLKAGQSLVKENLHLPENDIFAFTSENTPWHNHEWLAQVIMYLFYDMGDGTVQNGIQLVILLKALILLVTYLLVFGLAYRETKSIPVAVIVAMWAMLLSRRTIYPRPPVFSYMFFAGFLFLLCECSSGRISKKWLWVFLPLMVVWVNLHGGFMLGIILVGAWFLSSFVKNY